MLPKFGFKSRNIPILYLDGFISGLYFFLPVLALYLQQNLFTPANVALVFSIQALGILVFEVPTGAIADLFGRRNTLLLSSITAFLSLIPLYIGGGIEVFALYAILNALAMSLSSGTDVAIIFDTLKNERKESQYKKVVGILASCWPFGAAIGSIVGGYMAAVSMKLPFLAAFVPAFICIMLKLMLVEPKYEKEKHRSIPHHMSESLKLVFGNRQISILICSGFVLWGISETLHNLSSLFIDSKGIPLEFFGYIFAAMFAFSAIGHYFSHDLSKRIGNKNTLLFSALISSIFLIVSTMVFGFAFAMLFSIRGIFFGLRNPVLSHMLNLEVPSSKRATMHSISSMASNVGFAIFSVIIGILATIYSINTAFLASGFALLIVPVMLLYLKDKN